MGVPLLHLMSSDRLSQLRAMLQDEPGDPFLRYAIALELNRGGAREQACKDLEALVREAPDHVPSYYQLASILVDLGRTSDAIEVCDAGSLQCIVSGDRKTRGELLALKETIEEVDP